LTAKLYVILLFVFLTFLMAYIVTSYSTSESPQKILLGVTLKEGEIRPVLKNCLSGMSSLAIQLLS